MKLLHCLLILLVIIGNYVIDGKFTSTIGKRLNKMYKQQMEEQHKYDDIIEFGSNQTLWFTQTVDHFDFFNDKTYQQKYMVVDDYYVEGGPIFFYLAGEAAMSFFGFQEQQVINWAKEFSALFIVLEHRYYGESFPVSDVSTENLKYLTSQQALADAANFLATYTQDNNLVNNQAVVFGCSYSGALSAWFRTKYPHLVVASIAPSGPVEAQLDFYGYYQQFSKSAAPNCVEAAQAATNEIMALIETRDGRKQLEKTFNSCHSLDDPRDQYYFLYTITDVLGGSDQMNNPPTWILNSTCSTLLQNSNYVENWYEIMSAGSTTCNDFRLKSFIDQMKETSIDKQDGSREWVFQTCVEFGYFSTTYPGTSVFPSTLNIDEQVKWCEEIFDIPHMTPNINATNSYYGGKNIQGTNIMFTNGLLDPWHLLSVTENNSQGTVLSSVYQAGHCGSLIASTPNDPDSLIQTREDVVTFLKQVLSN